MQQKYKETFEERSVPAGDRVYCSKRSCGVFIPLKSIKKPIPAQHVHRAVMKPGKSSSAYDSTSDIDSGNSTSCRGDYHRDGDCPNDPQLQATMQFAEEQGWKRCYSCRTLVEHNRGMAIVASQYSVMLIVIECIHMTCKCKAEFCYICSARWRTCNCADSQLRAVLEAAESARAAAALEEQQAEARIRAEAAAAREAEQLARIQEAEFQEILQEIEEYEAREAVRMAAEEEELRREAQLRREQQEAERISFIGDHFSDLRYELYILHMYQKIAMTPRHEEITRPSNSAKPYRRTTLP